MVPIFPLYLVVLLMNPWRPKFSLSFVWNVCTNSRKNMKSTSLQVQITLIKVVAFLFLRKQSEKREDMLHTSITSGHASSIRVIKLRSYICLSEDNVLAMLWATSTSPGLAWNFTGKILIYRSEIVTSEKSGWLGSHITLGGLKEKTLNWIEWWLVCFSGINGITHHFLFRVFY